MRGRAFVLISRPTKSLPKQFLSLPLIRVWPSFCRRKASKRTYSAGCSDFSRTRSCMGGAKSEPQEPRRGRQQLSAIVSALGASRRSWAASKNGNRWPRLHWVVFHSTVRSFFLESTHFDHFSPSSFVHIYRFFLLLLAIGSSTLQVLTLLFINVLTLSNHWVYYEPLRRQTDQFHVWRIS